MSTLFTVVENVIADNGIVEMSVEASQKKLAGGKTRVNIVPAIKAEKPIETARGGAV